MPATPSGAFGLQCINAGEGTIRPGELDNGITSGYGTSIFEGDPVLVAAGKLTIGGGGNGFDAVFVGCEYVATNDHGSVSRYWPASQAYKPNGLGNDEAGNGIGIKTYFQPTANYPFEVLADGAVAQTAIGSLANLVAPVSTDPYHGSQAFIDHTTVGTGADVRIVGVGRSVLNAWGIAQTVVRVINPKAAPAFTR
jgi:hypothetical protein